MSNQPNLFDDDKPRKKRKNPKTEYEQALFQALCDVCSMPVKCVTQSARSRINGAVKQLSAPNIKATPEQVIKVGRAIRSRWPNCELTPTSIAANWPNFICAAPVRTITPGAPSRKEVEEREREDRYWEDYHRDREALDAEES